jgi:predicted DsbA family dithiol-disulfide isomerase
LPPEGIDRRDERTARLGGWDEASALDARVAAAGRLEGIDFAVDRVGRTPNTFDAHRLIALAGREGVQEPVVEALFRAYFTEGRDLGRRPVLLDVVAGAGLDAGRAGHWLDSGGGVAEVRVGEARARRLGILGVPYFVLGPYALNWAWDADTIAAALVRLHGLSDVAAGSDLPLESAPARERYGFPRTRCGCDFCRAYCRHTPGMLDVDDIARLCPQGEDVFAWAEQHLQAVTDRPYPKLVPARQANGHCHWYVEGNCAVHENAPYGCAYFDAHQSPAEVEQRSRAVTRATREDAASDGLYHRVWHHLRDLGLTRPSSDRVTLAEEVRLIRRSMEAN